MKSGCMCEEAFGNKISFCEKYFSKVRFRVLQQKIVFVEKTKSCNDKHFLLLKGMGDKTHFSC